MSNSQRLIAIGNFDGVHLGHQHLLSGVVAEAGRVGLRPAVMTFDPHPAAVLGYAPPAVLTAPQNKVALLRAQSPELEVIVQPFDLVLSRFSPRQFAEKLLVGQLAAARVVVGANFRFGHQRAGDLETLRKLGAELGFTTGVTDLMTDGQEVISSTQIRQAIRAGEMERAERLLGRPHEFWGTVVKGDQRGRTLGFPTANLTDVIELLPAQGVYACRVQTKPGAEWVSAIGNLGVRPTVEGEHFSVEVHILDFGGDLYGKRLGVQPLFRIREERQFDSLDALKTQIQQDVALARERLSESNS